MLTLGPKVATALRGIKQHPRWLVALGLTAVCLGAIVWQWDYIKNGVNSTPKTPLTYVQHSPLGIDLNTPDVLIQSENLASLPKDLLKVPLLHDTLTEDFVFYYQSNADRLGLAGSIRRIAYEHKLTLQDTLITDLLKQPAQLALWRTNDGKLTYSLLRIKTGALTQLTLTLASALQSITQDKQLAPLQKIQVGNRQVQFYNLRYAPNKSLTFALENNFLLVYSDPTLLITTGEAGVEVALTATNLADHLLKGEDIFAQAFGLPDAKFTHRISVNAAHLALGYGAFFPALAGIRFEMDDKGWHSLVAVNAQLTASAIQTPNLWAAMPADASLCIGLPLAVEQLHNIINQYAPQQPEQASITSAMTGNASACWFPNSRLFTPLISVELNENHQAAELDTQLAALFASSIHGIDAPTEEPLNSSGNMSGKIWQSLVASRYGNHEAAQLSPPLEINEAGFFRVSLAHAGNRLLFSLDDTLVKHGLDTVNKHYPALTEKIPAQASVPLFVSPAKLAPLLEQEAMTSLPADQEAVFHNAAQQHLLPKIHALKKYPDYALRLPDSLQVDRNWQWLPLEWQAL